MKFSPFVPEYSSLIKLLKLLHEFSVGRLHNFIKKTEKLNIYLYDACSVYSYKRIQEEHNLSDKVISDLKYFYEETEIIPSSKYILFAEHHGLICKVEGNKIGKSDSFFYYLLTNLGGKFVEKDLVTVAEIDNKEMLLFILEDIKQYEESDGLSLMMAMDNFYPLLHSSANYDFTESRENNLVDRKLLCRNKDRYKISKKGLCYLNYFKHMQSGKSYVEKFFLVQNDIERLKMMEWLYSINPYEFERLISLLLEKIGYYNVNVTSKGNDGGIDVTAEIKSGTSIIKEIVQVKRWKSNIQRPTLDQIRGVLSVSKATRGSIITTSDFSQGCYDSLQDNNSITLINGENLIDLLLTHKLGFSETNVSFYKFSPQLKLSE